MYKLSLLYLLLSFTIINSTIHVAMYGNPGSGKSTLLNCLTEAGNFPSGLSKVTGLTKQLSTIKYHHVVYIDTPGLNDVHDREKAALEIEESLKMNENYKLIFVVAPTSGRMNAGDLATMNMIIQSIPDNIEFGIIYNKLSKRVYREYIEDPDLLEQFHKTLLEREPHSYLLLENLNELDELDNAMTSNEKFISNLRNYVDQLPATLIPKEKVEPIPVNEYENKLKEMELNYNIALKEYQQQIDTLQEKYNNSCVKYFTDAQEQSTPFERNVGTTSKISWTLKKKKRTIIEKGQTVHRYLRTNCVKGTGEIEYGEWIYTGTREVVESTQTKKSDKFIFRL